MLTKQDIIAFANLDNSKTGEIEYSVLELPLIEIIAALVKNLNIK